MSNKSEAYRRFCDHCKMESTVDGHDGCLGTLFGVMNACCGHGDKSIAYVQFLDGMSVNGPKASIILDIIKENSLDYELDPNRLIVIDSSGVNIKKNKPWEDSMVNKSNETWKRIL